MKDYMLGFLGMIPIEAALVYLAITIGNLVDAANNSQDFGKINQF